MEIIRRRLLVPWLLLSCSVVLISTDAALVESIVEGELTYELHYNKLPYSWTDANQLCYDQQSAIARPPFSVALTAKLQTEYSLAGEVWVSNENSDCQSLREICEETRQSAFGERCLQHSLVTMTTDCQSKKRYVICSKETTTTTTSTTTTTTTTMPTSTTRAPARVTLPLSTTGRPYPQPTAITSQPEYPSEPIPSGSGEKPAGGQTHLTKFGHALIGISMVNTDLLGLIIGVVIGSFLIITLILVLCCACQGQKPRRNSKQDYEYMERNSEHSLLKAAQSDSNNSSNTIDQPTRLTEESSLEMSEAHSHSSRLLTQLPPKNYNYPPPPSIYNGSSSGHYSEIPSPKLTGLAGAHNSNIVARMSPGTVTYASINKNRDSVMSADFPPPPPQRGYDGLDIEDDDGDETCIKGLDPTFKTFLNQTIAVKPQPPVSPVSPVRGYHRNYPPHLSVDGAKLPAPPPSSGAAEKPGLITSDL